MYDIIFSEISIIFNISIIMFIVFFKHLPLIGYFYPNLFFYKSRTHKNVSSFKNLKHEFITHP